MRTTKASMWLLPLLVGLMLAGCSGAELPDGETADDVPPAAPEPAVSDPEPDDVPAAPAALKVAVVTEVTVTRVEVEQAEDGRGGLVAAVAPVAIEIAAEAWPVRALDPVLRVGELEFKHYTFSRLNVLRYVAADASALPTDAEVSVQYGDDARSRIVVAERLEVPR